MSIVIYAICTLTSLACALMLARGYRRSGFRLLLWSTLCFWGFFLNNLLIIADLVIFPETDLYAFRQIIALTSLGLLLYGQIWESR